MTTTTFTGMHTVAVPVTDQERTKALFERFGLQTGLDTELQPGFRWIEMALADSRTSLALVHTGPELPAGIDTGIRLATTDARAAHASVIELGLDAGELSGPGGLDPSDHPTGRAVHPPQPITAMTDQYAMHGRRRNIHDARPPCRTELAGLTQRDDPSLEMRGSLVR